MSTKKGKAKPKEPCLIHKRVEIFGEITCLDCGKKLGKQALVLKNTELGKWEV